MAQFIGTVIGTKIQKTAKVSVTRMFLHPHVLKYVRKCKVYFARDEQEECREGDRVMIRECGPIFDKRTRFRVSEILERAGHHSTPLTARTMALDDTSKKLEEHSGTVTNRPS